MLAQPSDIQVCDLSLHYCRGMEIHVLATLKELRVCAETLCCVLHSEHSDDTTAISY